VETSAAKPPVRTTSFARRVLVALAPLPCFALTILVVTYAFQDQPALDGLLLLPLVALPASAVASVALNTRGLAWRDRAPLWTLTVASALTSCLVTSPVEHAARWLWERRVIAPRREALVALANDPAARARVEREGGLWVLDRDTPTIDGYTFERAAFTRAGAWFVLRPARGIFGAEGFFVPFAGVLPAQVELEGGALRPEWVTYVAPCSVDGLARFRGRDGMSGGGAGWLLARSYERAR
jgi:hypothetical protein